MGYAFVIALAAFIAAALAWTASGLAFKRDLEPAREAAKAAAAAESRRRASARQAKFGEAAATLERIIPLKSGQARELRDKLDAAGMKIDPTAWRLAQAGFAVVGCLLFALLGPLFELDAWLTLAVAIAGAGVGWCFSGLWLASKASSRSELISRKLPSVLELLAIVVSAGMMVERGFRQVAEDDEFFPLSEEFARVDREINQLGYTRVEALQALSKRCGNTQLDYFCAAMIEATKKGSSISDVLMAQAAFARKARRDYLVEKARRVASTMALPLSLFFIPAVLIVVMAPNVAVIVDLFSNLSISF